MTPDKIAKWQQIRTGGWAKYAMERGSLIGVLTWVVTLVNVRWSAWWQIGVAFAVHFTFGVALAGLVYWPIREWRYRRATKGRPRHSPFDELKVPANRTDRARFSLSQFVSNIEIPSGAYAVAFCDMDMGSIMGGLPDRRPEIFENFEEALAAASTNSDEEEVGIFNSRKKLILWRYGWERFTVPGDPVEISRDGREGRL